MNQNIHSHAAIYDDKQPLGSNMVVIGYSKKNAENLSYDKYICIPTIFIQTITTNYTFYF